jgi:hypothetical protein
VPCQRVHRTVEGLVRDGLLLITSAGKDDGLQLGFETLEKSLDERGLSGSRRAGHEYYRRLAAANKTERFCQFAKLAVASDQLY